VLPRFFPGVAGTAAGILAFLLVNLPWLAYQTWADPPGNRLAVQHLAGLSQLGETSLLRAIRNGYAALSPSEVLRNKLANAEVLFLEKPEEVYSDPGVKVEESSAWTVSGWRRREVHNLVFALGIMNLGWLAIGLSRLRRRWLAYDRRQMNAVLFFALVNVVVWVLLMFGPGTTVLHQGSYVPVLLLSAALGAGIWSLSAFVGRLVFLLQAAWFFLAWVILSPANAFAFPNYWMIPVMVACAALLGWTALRPETVSYNERM
jgi:hypothetical protein